jgi:hypothetical protein
MGFKSLIGQKFGKLVVLNQLDPTYCFCQCTCGNLKYILRTSLTRKNRASKSCGCIQHKQVSERMFEHGESNPPSIEYTTWQNMKQRCYDNSNPSYVDYGGRGIKVCKKWLKSYKVFLEDLGRKPGLEYSLDRINNDGDYKPSNCHWATKSEQMLNRRSWNWSKSAREGYKQRCHHRVLTHK